MKWYCDRMRGRMHVSLVVELTLIGKMHEFLVPDNRDLIAIVLNAYIE